ncbi:GIY-YIG nuclease family protein [Bradyrhizobium sp. DN5]|uniref:GIY-YIG nuclease family protein n=1 Tax=Bradyrhizobium sp. DN5 TaxID=3056950 RepID=UPI00352314EB
MLTFRHALESAGVSPSDVCVLRHQDARADPGRNPYQLFLRDRAAFDEYQAVQSFDNRSRLRARYWASFVGTPGKGTLFCGLYASRYLGAGDVDLARPHQRDRINQAGSYDRYELSLQDELQQYIGVLFIDWGDGWRSWIQRNTDKPIVELCRQFQELRYPGHLAFLSTLSELPSIPTGWIEVLRSTKGIYLLTCPKTKEQYVGKASGEEGFWGRWQDYMANSHGGNVLLKSRDPSDYQVSILETVGSTNEVDLDSLEARWKRKLQSREMGLNAN